jgi:hypothetical protein
MFLCNHQTYLCRVRTHIRFLLKDEFALKTELKKNLSGYYILGKLL